MNTRDSDHQIMKSQRSKKVYQLLELDVGSLSITKHTNILKLVIFMTLDGFKKFMTQSMYNLSGRKLFYRDMRLELNNLCVTDSTVTATPNASCYRATKSY